MDKNQITRRVMKILVILKGCVIVRYVVLFLSVNFLAMPIYLVGVLHDDPGGYACTKSALKKFQPSMVGVEWAGDEYERFRESDEVVRLQAEMDEAIRRVFCELGLDQSLYDEGNTISNERSFGEVRAVRDYSSEEGLVVVATESAESRIAMDRNFLSDVDGACRRYRNWLTSLIESREGYNPEAINVFDPWEYDAFEAHLNGDMSQENAKKWLENGYIPGAINEPRVSHQVRQVREAVRRLGENDVFVHVGGLAHLIDDGLAETRGPINLWQHLVSQFRDRVSRHSLRTV